jgi:hypothetical protein
MEETLMKVENYIEIDTYAKEYGYLYRFECKSDKGNTFYLMTNVFSPTPIRKAKIPQLTYFKNKGYLTRVIRNSHKSFDSVAKEAIAAFNKRQEEIADAKARRDELDKTRDRPATQEEITEILDREFAERGWERNSSNWNDKAKNFFKKIRNALKK